MTKPTQSQLLIKLDAGTLKRFRIACVDMDTNMSEEIRIMIEDWLVRYDYKLPRWQKDGQITIK